MESTADKLRALALAIGLHVLCMLGLFVGLWWTADPAPRQMPGQVIEAELIGPTAAPMATTAAKPVQQPPAAPPPAPTPPKAEPEPPAAPQEEEIPPPPLEQDLIERERIAALAADEAENVEREQRERQRQQQILLEEQERERQERADQRAAQLKELADLRAQREAAERSVNREREKLAQLEDQARAQQQAATDNASAVTEHQAERAQTGAGGDDDSLAARYQAAIQAVVTQNWNRPESAQPGLLCKLHIVQIPGGEVLSVRVGTPCNADQITRNSIEQAVMKAEPLPYQGYEKVFQRSIDLNFRYER